MTRAHISVCMGVGGGGVGGGGVGGEERLVTSYMWHNTICVPIGPLL